MGKQLAQTCSPQDIAVAVARRLNVSLGIVGDPESDTTKVIVDEYHALYQGLEWRGETPWNIDLTPVRLKPAIVDILAARLWPNFKGEPSPARMERDAWMQFNANNSPAASWAPVVGQYF